MLRVFLILFLLSISHFSVASNDDNCVVMMCLSDKNGAKSSAGCEGPINQFITKLYSHVGIPLLPICTGTNGTEMGPLNDSQDLGIVIAPWYNTHTGCWNFILTSPGLKLVNFC